MTIDEMVAALKRANQHLADAAKREQEASTHTTAARNAVDDLQKQLDAAIMDLRAEAPRGTYWHDHVLPEYVLLKPRK